MIYLGGKGLWYLGGSGLCIAQSNEAGKHKNLHVDFSLFFYVFVCLDLS